MPINFIVYLATCMGQSNIFVKIELHAAQATNGSQFDITGGIQS